MTKTVYTAGRMGHGHSLILFKIIRINPFYFTGENAPFKATADSDAAACFYIRF